jgi:hypothetical protein
MWTPEVEEEWARLSTQVLTEIGEWRAAHPRATLREIEQEVDARLAPRAIPRLAPRPRLARRAGRRWSWRGSGPGGCAPRTSRRWP